MSAITDLSTGTTASIGADRRLKVAAISESENSASNDRGDGFNINTGVVAITADTSILYLKNDDPRDLVLEAFVVGFGVGTYTTENKVTIVKNPTAGTLISGASPVDMNENRNFGSSLTLASEAYKGASGSTLTDGTNVGVFFQVGSGRLFAPIDLLLAKGNSIGIKIATGSTSINVYAAVIAHLHNPS